MPPPRHHYYMHFRAVVVVGIVGRIIGRLGPGPGE
jgi:hypothetical protein